MKFKIGFYWFCLMVLITLSSCRNNFEWININPEKIQLARKYQPVKEKKFKTVSLNLNLKEKGNEIYFAESAGFFAQSGQEQISSNAVPLNTLTAESNEKTVVKPSSVVKSNNFKKSPLTKSTEKSNDFVPTGKTEESAIILPITKDMANQEKLNGALILPLKASTKKNDSSQRLSNKVNTKAQSEMRSKAIDDIKKQNPELKNKQEEKIRRGQYLMLGGLILTVFGVIAGAIFGKSAYIISIVGVVFAAIGAFMKYYVG